MAEGYVDRRGFVHLARKSINSDVWKKGPLCWQIWCCLLMRARGRAEPEQLNDGTILRRGQLVTSYPEIASELKYPSGRGWKTPAIPTVKKHVRFLVQERSLILNVVGKGLIVTVCNYEEYNPLRSESYPDEEPKRNRYATPSQSPNKKVEEGKEGGAPEDGASEVKRIEDHFHSFGRSPYKPSEYSQNGETKAQVEAMIGRFGFQGLHDRITEVCSEHRAKGDPLGSLYAALTVINIREREKKAEEPVTRDQVFL